MDRDLKFTIITEGQKQGIALTCRKYGISRTLYYRWLQRYKSFGISGLDDIKKNFTPVNKTKTEVESTILNLIRKHPNYGPREIKYLLEKIDHHISESAVYNVMKRNNLTTRSKRIRFSNKRQKNITTDLPDFNSIKSGEGWLFWTTFCGCFEGIGPVYEYTIFDFKSRIACTRLYSSLSMEIFEDILTAVAIPVAQHLNLDAKHLCFLQDNKIMDKKNDSFINKIYEILQSHGLEIDIHLLKEQDSCNTLDMIKKHREDYTHGCLSYLMPFVHSGTSFKDLKIGLQKYIRNYNIHQQQDYDGVLYSPIGYHVKAIDSEMVLPLWAYIEREY
ncbi:helix-turn-helix domain-containing protein [Alkaliphilus hydrothermalis]|uniref:Transposase-like protein n=1 Tax=Alkaliphilus hydrothermalis TaxID=1482730 RepID=A0ABS2NNN7_9FIRM|nr:helix-turn-helix domain-containing protein [Alkaliphilus hydrothermalis]MBM7614555.1 transposase-like protein [Alkaliphilus hydrothermalis]